MMELIDVNNRLARWQLRLMEFDFKLYYRKGAKNTIADAVSRLPTWGYTNVDPDLYIPCFPIFITSGPNTFDTVGDENVPHWESQDWDPDRDANLRYTVLSVVS